MEEFHPSKDDSDESKGKGAQTGQFQFINVGAPSKDEQAKNRTLARSHTATVVHRAQRKTREEARRQGRAEFTFVEGHGAKNALSSTADRIAAGKLDRKTKRYLQQRFMAGRFFGSRSWAPNSARVSQKPTIDSTISALQTYKAKVTPDLHMILEDCKAIATM
jgi:hypothetical protein